MPDFLMPMYSKAPLKTNSSINTDFSTQKELFRNVITVKSGLRVRDVCVRIEMKYKAAAEKMADITNPKLKSRILALVG